MLYPILLKPVYQERLWGGRSLETLFHKPLPSSVPIGESWEVADRPEGVSVIANGPLAGQDLRWLMETHPGELLGRAATVSGRFPLLVKILDAQDVLSVQVHPPANVAPSLGGEPKTEMWYVASAAKKAEILAGLRAGTTAELFSRHVVAGTVDQCLHRIPVKVGDAMFLPSGRVHALGPGLVIFEIQQNSNTTYRVFDWNRLGPDGQGRALHLKPALASIDFHDYEPNLISAAWVQRERERSRPLVNSPLFQVRECHFLPEASAVPGQMELPTIVAVVRGALRVSHEESGITLDLVSGQCALIPASAATSTLHAQAETVCLLAQPGATETSSPPLPASAASLTDSSGSSANQGVSTPPQEVPRAGSAAVSAAPVAASPTGVEGTGIAHEGSLVGSLETPSAAAPNSQSETSEPPFAVEPPAQSAFPATGAKASEAKATGDAIPPRSSSSTLPAAKATPSSDFPPRSPARADRPLEGRTKPAATKAKPSRRGSAWGRFFAYAFVLLVVGGVLTVGTVPKIWLVTPPGFEPQKYVRGADLAEAWFCQWTAQRAMGQHEYHKAIEAWREAIACNPADADYSRGLIRSLLGGPKLDAAAVSLGSEQAHWLLNLTATNHADLALAVQWFDRIFNCSEVRALLTPRSADLTPPLEKAYLKALFFTGAIDQFAERYAKLPAKLQNDPEVKLFQVAAVAAWGPAAAARTAAAQLAAAETNSSPRQVLANRLELLVAAHRRQVGVYQQSLDRLRTAHADTVFDYVNYWRLLERAGHVEEARKLARAFTRAPRDNGELVALVNCLLELGLNGPALQHFQTQVPDSTAPESVWIAYAATLATNHRWADLRQAGADLRDTEAGRGPLAAAGLLLQGMGAAGAGQKEAAAKHFAHLARLGLGSGTSTLEAAQALLKAGWAAPAAQLLQQPVAERGLQLRYCDLAFRVALRLKDEGLLLRSARLAYHLQPQNLNYAAWYAAALLIKREQPELALQLTKRLLAAEPKSNAARINYSLALLANGRMADARQVLAALGGKQLAAAEANSYAQARFELEYLEHKASAARAALAQVRLDGLFPTPRRWIEAAAAKLPPR